MTLSSLDRLDLCQRSFLHLVFKVKNIWKHKIFQPGKLSFIVSQYNWCWKGPSRGCLVQYLLTQKALIGSGCWGPCLVKPWVLPNMEISQLPSQYLTAFMVIFFFLLMYYWNFPCSSMCLLPVTVHLQEGSGSVFSVPWGQVVAAVRCPLGLLFSKLNGLISLNFSSSLSASFQF